MKKSNQKPKKQPKAIKQKAAQEAVEEASGTILAKRTRPNKPDFAPSYTKHRKILESKECGVDIEKMIKLRRLIHQYPEGKFQEFETQKRIRDTLLGFGVKPKDIKDCAGTGLVVDIKGTGPASPLKKGDSTVQSIALRADIDGLPMPENNPHLEYRSKTGFAHMCGHDGHTATILSAVQALQNNRHKIPSNRFVRILFQPAEEGPGGAKPMIKEGCLKNISEVYGYHNIPNFDEGDIRVCEGGFFAEGTLVKITIRGQGGHGSAPHKLRDPITAMTTVHSALNTIQSRNIDSRHNVVFTICHMESGHTYNVFPDTAFMQGTIRSYDKESLVKIKERIVKISESIAEGLDCKAEVEIIDYYPPVINHPEQTAHVIRLAKKYIGEEHFSQEELPLAAAEDFSYYLEEIPGCFFALGTMKEGEKLKTLHTSTYDYNDNLIPTGAYFFLRIVEDRLGVQILPEEQDQEQSLETTGKSKRQKR